MFHRLRIQLTLLCTSVTLVVLSALTLLCLLFQEAGIKKEENTSFSSNLSAIYQNLQQQAILSHNWIRQMEFHYQLMLRLTDNGSPLLYQTLHEDAATKDLLSQAKTEAAARWGIDLDSTFLPRAAIEHAEFPLTGSSSAAPFLAAAARIPRDGGVVTLLALHSLAPMHRRLRAYRRIFLLSDLAALLVLSLFYWWMSGRMIRPLRESRERQTAFIAAASHELRSPLTVMLSHAEGGKSGSVPTDSLFWDTLLFEGERLSRLIDEMLQLASADNQRLPMHISAAALDTLLLDLWEAWERIAKEREVRWQIDLPEDTDCVCRCDPQRIRQLLTILIDNAMRFTPREGCITLRLDIKKELLSPQGFSLSVADTGPGIPEQEKEAVFTRFYRGDPSRGEKAHYGLGLSIAAEIAKAHGGTLLLTDTPGGGATFTLTLRA